jgi:omega-amidase
MNLRIVLFHGPAVLAEGRWPAADLVVFPELVDGGYAALAADRATHSPGDEFLRRIAAASKRRRAVVLAGSLRLTNGRAGCTNTSLLFSRGKVLHRYDKIHLFRPTGDHHYFVPGRKAQVTEVAIRRRPVRIGMVICFDLRFPELVRALAFRRMELLIVPARWPAARTEAWKTLLRARAIENQAFVIGCNAAGPEGGPSFVFGPAGAPVPRLRTLRSGGDLYSIDLNDIERARTLYHALKEARWFGKAKT